MIIGVYIIHKILRFALILAPKHKKRSYNKHIERILNKGGITMAPFEKELISLLSTDLFLSLLNSNKIKFSQLLAIQTLLFKAGIPFDLAFSPGTRRVVSTALLTIFINPQTTLRFTISFNDDGSVFTSPT